MSSEERIPCPLCEGLIIKGAVRCRFCKESLVGPKAGAHVETSGKKVPEKKVVLPSSSRTDSPKEEIVQSGGAGGIVSFCKFLLVAVFLVLIGVASFYEYRAYGFIEDARGYGDEGLVDVSCKVYQHVVDKYQFSFFVVEANEKVGGVDKFLLPLWAGWICTGGLLLMFLIRMFSGRSLFFVFLFAIVSGSFLVVQLVWYGTLKFEPLNEFAKFLMEGDIRVVYGIGYFLLLVLAGFVPSSFVKFD